MIEPLGILPAYQGRGYGRLLLQLVLRELAARGAKKVEIGTWRDNEAAVHLYRVARLPPAKNSVFPGLRSGLRSALTSRLRTAGMGEIGAAHCAVVSFI